MMYSSAMDAISLLADPTRRRIIELLTERERSAGELAAQFEIARPGVSRHLRQLREGGLVSVTRDGQRQIYRLEPEALMELDRWLAPIRTFWTGRLDALDTEVRRGKRSRQVSEDRTPANDGERRNESA